MRGAPVPQGAAWHHARRVWLAPGSGARTKTEKGGAGFTMSAGMLLASWGESVGIHSATCTGRGSMRPELR
jgi:hypothetical protein